jgi:hypothetical protein
MQGLSIKLHIAAAAFLVASAGALGAGALSNIHIKGSDTLFDVTGDVLASCPGATGLIWDGTGANNGESAAKTGSQQIYPSTAQIGTANGCAVASPNGSPAAAEILVLGLDGLSVVASQAQAGTTACNGAVADCDSSTDPGTGVAYGTTVTLSTGTYTFNGWKDVLRVLYAGLDHNGGSNIANQACNSELRQTIANNWSKFFQNASCTSGTCTQIRHVFRRDDAAATADVFVKLLGLPATNAATNTNTFCNVLQANATLPAGVNRLPADYQDNDPIRRTLAGTNNGATPSKTLATEQVGSRKGDLGLVVTIYAPDGSLALSDAFPTSACTTSTIFGIAPTVIAGGGTSGGVGRCPNGDIPVFSNGCLVPVDANGSASCLASKSTRPAFIFDNTPVDGVAPAAADGRVYNLNLYKADGTYNKDKRSPARSITGAYYRLHSTRTLNLPDTSAGACQQLTADRQIGCLVQASPCSIGFGGRDASNQPGAVALKVNQLDPTNDCVQAFRYPLARKVSLNTLTGFENVTGQELSLSQCFADNTLVNASLAARGFVGLGSAAPGGGIYCEDFNEQALCGAASNSNACANNAGVSLPTQNTVCGNGVVEYAEDCDNGAANGAAPAACSTGCRFN